MSGAQSCGGALGDPHHRAARTRVGRNFGSTGTQRPADQPQARLPVRARDLPQPRMRLIGRAQRASAEEIAANPRARSAVMRVAERNRAANA